MDPDQKKKKLKVAQAAFDEFYHVCFWFMRRDTMVTEELLPYVIKRLRADGGRKGFQKAAELCR